MPFIGKVRVLFKTRLIFPRINGSSVLKVVKVTFWGGCNKLQKLIKKLMFNETPLNLTPIF